MTQILQKKVPDIFASDEKDLQQHKKTLEAFLKQLHKLSGDFDTLFRRKRNDDGNHRRLPVTESSTSGCNHLSHLSLPPPLFYPPGPLPCHHMYAGKLSPYLHQYSPYHYFPGIPPQPCPYCIHNIQDNLLLDNKVHNHHSHQIHRENFEHLVSLPQNSSFSTYRQLKFPNEGHYTRSNRDSTEINQEQLSTMMNQIIPRVNDPELLRSFLDKFLESQKYQYMRQDEGRSMKPVVPDRYSLSDHSMEDNFLKNEKPSKINTEKNSLRSLESSEPDMIPIKREASGVHHPSHKLETSLGKFLHNYFESRNIQSFE